MHDELGEWLDNVIDNFDKGHDWVRNSPNFRISKTIYDNLVDIGVDSDVATKAAMRMRVNVDENLMHLYEDRIFTICEKFANTIKCALEVYSEEFQLPQYDVVDQALNGLELELVTDYD